MLANISHNGLAHTLTDGSRLLSLNVQNRLRDLQRCRDSAAERTPEKLTRRFVFAWCGKLVAHFSVHFHVCGWLRPATAWLKRRSKE